jgi:hypothetical protein
MKPIFTKPAPITKSLWLCLCLLFTVPVFAQTPTVLTIKASNVSSTETPEGGANISISATLNGAVNANGTNCTVSFEYGNTTSYGNTIAAGTVTGSTDNSVGAGVTINYTATGPQERLIHYRLKVTNEYGTYYGRDFIATPIDPTRNIFISATCTDHPTWAYYELQNNNSFDITVNYTAGASYTGSVIIGSQQVQQINVGKGSICSFAYHYTLFRQVVTNDQPCSETQLPKQKIFMTATGKIASDKMMYRIENSNSSSVNIEILCGSSNYTYTIAPQSVAYFAGTLAEAQIGISGEAFAISSPSGGYAYEGMDWLSVTPLSTTATTANFELYNRDDATHTFVMRNAGGTENSYTLAAYESRTVTLANENWDVYTTIWDPTGMWYGHSYDNIYTGPAFGDAAYCNNGLLKVATVIPGSSITASVTPSTIASSTSLTLNGVISNSAFANTDVDYHFIYGTDPNNLNQSTSTQSGTVPASGSLNVNATVTGLTEGTLYYYKLVTGEITSSTGKIFLSSSIPSSNLKLWLRSDLAVTSASSAVSTWGDVCGLGNDATQSTGGNQPTLVESAINGNPALQFNGTSSKMSLPTSLTLGVQSNPYEMFIVAKSSSSNIQFLIAGGATEQFEYHLNGMGARFIPTTTVYLDKGTDKNYTDGNAHLFSARASSSGGAVRVNGIDGGTTSNNILSSNAGNLLLGVRSNGAYFLNGEIAEVILYNRVLSAEERTTVEQYLKGRYAISGYTASTFQTDGNWSAAANWSNGLPETTTNVTMAANCTVDGNYSVNDATVNSSAAVTVGAGNTLTVGRNFILKSDASNTASLINNGTIDVTGTTSVERYMTGGKWHIVSPTAAGGSISTFIQAAGNAIPSKSGSYGMMDYNETTNAWNSYYTASTSDNLTSGKGYSVRRTADGTVTFTGTLTSGTKPVTLTKLGADGWNCVGNPYPSAINMNTSTHETDNFIYQNSGILDDSYACVYVWDEDASYSGQSCYKIISNSGFTLPAGRASLGQDYVAPGQGFFVKAKTAGTDITFTTAMKTHLPTTALKSAKASWPGFQLTATSSNAKASTVVAFNNAMTKGLDVTYDGGLLRGTSGLNLYSRLVDDNGVDFAIQCLPETYSSLVIPIGLESKTGGEISFSAETVELPTACSVILEDKLAKTFTSLANGATYKTTVSAGTTAVGRFYIHTSNSTTGISVQTGSVFNLKAYPADGQIWIIGEVANGAKASLFDVNGRNLGTFNLQEGSRNSISSAGLAPGVYLLNVTEASKRFNTKIVIY